MPLGFGGPVFTSSAAGDIGGGRQYTRLRGPILIGNPRSADSPAAGGLASATPPHIVNVSTARGDMLASVVSTFALASTSDVGTSSGLNVSTAAPIGLVYISMATGAGNLIAAGSTANAPTGLPGGASGVAMAYDAAAKTLALYDPFSSAWLWPHQAASSNVALGGVITWSASSS